MAEIEPAFDPRQHILTLKTQIEIYSAQGKDESEEASRTRQELLDTAKQANISDDELFELIFQPDKWEEIPQL
jgi:hypothetical protein